jgi:hypothetical protein
MKEIIFVSEELPRKLHTLTAWLNMDGDLVFDDGEVYSAGGGKGREVNDYLMVRAGHKSRVLDLLGQVFDGVSDTCGEAVDDRLFCTLERMARSGHWKSLDEIEIWLMDRGVSFTKQKWVK